MTGRWRIAPPAEREGLQKLQETLPGQTAETERKKQREKEVKATEEVFETPYKFTVDLIENPKSGRMNCPTEEETVYI